MLSSNKHSRQKMKVNKNLGRARERVQDRVREKKKSENTETLWPETPTHSEILCHVYPSFHGSSVSPFNFFFSLPRFHFKTAVMFWLSVPFSVNIPSLFFSLHSQPRHQMLFQFSLRLPFLLPYHNYPSILPSLQSLFLFCFQSLFTWINKYVCQ